MLLRLAPNEFGPHWDSHSLRQLMVLQEGAVCHQEGAGRAPLFETTSAEHDEGAGGANNGDGVPEGVPKEGSKEARGDTRYPPEKKYQASPSFGRHGGQGSSDPGRQREENARTVLGKSCGRGKFSLPRTAVQTLLWKQGHGGLVERDHGKLTRLQQLMGKSADGLAQVKKKVERRELSIVKEIKGQRKTGVTLAMEVAKSGQFKDKLKKFQSNFFAESSRKSRQCKREEIMKLALTITEGKAVLPLKKDVLEATAAAMKEAGMKSAVQYVLELKLLHIEAGFDWTAALQRSWSLCKRSLERAKGPVKRAAEVRIRELLKELMEVRSTKKGQPEWPVLAFTWAAIWMLREIELRNMKIKHVMMKDKEKQVSIWLPISKCDQTGKGVRRTLACCGCKKGCLPTCPWRLATLMLRRSRKFNSLANGSLMKTSLGTTPSKSGVIDAWKKNFAEEVTGHSPRRSGAMFYVRLGLQIQELAFLGRWRSSVVLDYAEEALQEKPMEVNYDEEENQVGKKRQLVDKVKVIPVEADVEGEGIKDLPRPPPLEEERANGTLKTIFETPKDLWVVTKGRGSKSRPAHWVVKATWNLPLTSWTTACGWFFAEKSHQFTFVVGLAEGQAQCQKCHNLKKGATSQGGVVCANLMQTSQDQFGLEGKRVRQAARPMQQTPPLKKSRREGGSADAKWSCHEGNTVNAWQCNMHLGGGWFNVVAILAPSQQATKFLLTGNLSFPPTHNHWVEVWFAPIWCKQAKTNLAWKANVWDKLQDQCSRHHLWKSPGGRVGLLMQSEAVYVVKCCKSNLSDIIRLNCRYGNIGCVDTGPQFHGIQLYHTILRCFQMHNLWVTSWSGNCRFQSLCHLSLRRAGWLSYTMLKGETKQKYNYTVILDSTHIQYCN